MRRLEAALLLMFVFVATAHAADVDPAAALVGAKANIAARKYAAAVSLINPAIDATGSIADAEQQKQALTALHFYAAVAYSGMAREADALTHLEESLRLSPGIHNIDATRFDSHFVALFQRARSDAGNTGRFEELYPGFSGHSVVTGNGSGELWESPGVEILGSRKEKHDWRAAVSPAAREEFMAAFWRARDASPGTEENDFRDTISRRITFADLAFESPGQRGAMSDRGRVFAVLGPPARVRRRALNNSDNANLTAFNRNSIGIDVGTIEYWVYTRDQLAVSQPAQTVTYRFVTHQGIGDYVLQKDGLAMNVLAKASQPPHE